MNLTTAAIRAQLVMQEAHSILGGKQAMDQSPIMRHLSELADALGCDLVLRDTDGRQVISLPAYVPPVVQIPLLGSIR